jgi:hypothetical protein
MGARLWLFGDVGDTNHDSGRNLSEKSETAPFPYRLEKRLGRIRASVLET